MTIELEAECVANDDLPAPALPVAAPASRRSPPARPRSRLLKSGVQGACLFMIPGLGGKSDGLELFGSLLDTAMPVYASEARGLDGSSLPLTALNEIVADNLHQLKELQPAGPYNLLGHSFGGLVAFELARQLAQNGEQIDRLILLDTPISPKYWPFLYYLQDVLSRFRRHAGALLTLPGRHKVRYFLEACDRFTRKFYDPYGLRRSGINVMIADRMAGDDYCPGFYDGRLTFFRAAIKDMPADPKALWLSRVSAIDINEAPGGHNSMLAEPYVTVLAARVSACLAGKGPEVGSAPSDSGRPHEAARMGPTTRDSLGDGHALERLDTTPAHQILLQDQDHVSGTACSHGR
jgi:thioesterase domain-containing protein